MKDSYSIGLRIFSENSIHILWKGRGYVYMYWLIGITKYTYMEGRRPVFGLDCSAIMTRIIRMIFSKPKRKFQGNV